LPFLLDILFELRKRTGIRYGEEKLKKWIISIFFLMLCAGCGIGAFFFFRQGTDTVQAEREKAMQPKLVGLSDITIQAGASLPESVSRVKATESVRKLSVDTTKVQTHIPGIYPIYYSYSGNDGKKYQEEIKCRVEEEKNVPKLDTQDEKIVPESGTQEEEVVPESDKLNESHLPISNFGAPKTGDTGKMILQVILIVFSSAAIGVILHRKVSYKKI